MKLNRNLEPGILEHYSNLLEENQLPSEFGGSYMISFTGEHVLKSPINDSPKNFDKSRKSLLHEYRIGIEAEKIGIEVPKVSAVYLQKGELPFLVMETKDLTNYEDLTISEQNEFDIQYREQLSLAIKHRLMPDDVSKLFNSAWDTENEVVVFYDFEHWSKMN